MVRLTINEAQKINKIGLNLKLIYGLYPEVILSTNNGFSRNLRKEITKNPRFYFIDIGIRNALINNFNTIDIRNDIGELWENYIIMERLKKQE